ncbi:MAG: hypothetical protein Q8P39_00540 [Candidatus Yanofskybacteria bacterium]|nr:hypothetical protein [Candidatus Yanofskybacteria bacterium]
METIFLAGLAGGIVRGLVGFIKHQYSYKDAGFNLSHFASMMTISGIIGVVAAVTVKELGLLFLGAPVLTPAMALIIGYAGGDFLENVFKIILQKPSFYSLPEATKKEQ